MSKKDIPTWLTHYDVPELGGHNYADVSPVTLEPGDVDQYGNTYCWEVGANTDEPQ